MTPFFSVVITTHNCSNTIPNTLKSVISQTIEDFEIIIVDDSSLDDSVQIVKNILHDVEIKYKIIELKKIRVCQQLEI